MKMMTPPKEVTPSYGETPTEKPAADMPAPDLPYSPMFNPRDDTTLNATAKTPHVNTLYKCYVSSPRVNSLDKK